MPRAGNDNQNQRREAQGGDNKCFETTLWVGGTVAAATTAAALTALKHGNQGVAKCCCAVSVTLVSSGAAWVCQRVGSQFKEATELMRELSNNIGGVAASDLSLRSTRKDGNSR